MPIYDYLCRECGKKFEALVRKPGIDTPQCPACGTENLEQEISMFLAPVPGKFKAKPQPHPEYPYGYTGKHDD